MEDRRLLSVEAFPAPLGPLDPLGNDLDGEPVAFPIPPNRSGDGVPGGDFVVHFSTDIVTSPYPVPLEPKGPPGSLIYDPVARGVIGDPADVDSFTIDVDDGQTISVLVETDSLLQATVELVDPASAVVGSATAAAAGRDALIQSIATTGPGTYGVRVSGVGSTTGHFTVRVLLNAALEPEQYDGPANDTSATAGGLDAHFISLGIGQAHRAAMLGSLASVVPIASDDFESGGLDSAWSTVSSEPEGRIEVVDALGARAGALALQMVRDDGGSENLNEAIWTVHVPTGINATLDFYYDFSNENAPLHSEFTGHANGTGVSISDDGNRWHTVLTTFFAPGHGSGQSQGPPGQGGNHDDVDWVKASIDLEAEAAAAGMSLGDNFRIKFQQYDGGPSFGGATFYDDLQLFGTVTQEDWYALTLDDVESMTLALSGSGRMEMYDSGLNLLAVGIDTASVDQLVANFIDPTTDAAPDTYFVRLFAGDEDYSLVATKNADFDAARGGQVADRAPDLTLAETVLGAIETSLAMPQPGISQVNLPTDLFDGEGYKWDILRDGRISNGTDDAYDGGLRLSRFPTFFTTGNAEDAGREIVIGPASIDSADVVRKIYVPPDRGFARYLEVVSNPTDSTLDFTVTVRTNLGSNTSTRVLRTSSGNSVFDQNDDWLVTDDGSTVAGDPTMLHVTSGPGGARPSLASLVGSDTIEFRYDLTLAPGETQIVMHFAAQNASPDTAFSKASMLAALQLDALAGMSQAETAQTVNFLIDSNDEYSISAQQGDVLSLQSAVPASGPLEFVNSLDVGLELFDPTGALVASDSSGALMHTAAQDGRYTVRVFGENETTGEYVLHVSGQTGALRPFEVTGSDPANGTTLIEATTTLRIDVSDQVLLSSAQGSDLLIDGVPATAMTAIDGDTLEFTFPPLADGTRSLSIPAGSMMDLQGQPIEAFSVQLFVDTTPPRVIGSSIQGGDIVPTDVPLVYTARFDEELLTGEGLGTNALRLEGTSREFFESFEYDPVTSTVTAQFSPLPEDHYTLTLLSGDRWFEDLVGLDLDGEPVTFPIPPNASGDGVEGGNFVVHFSTDKPTSAFPSPLIAKHPPGSLIYESSVEGLIGAPDDVDDLTIDVDGGQTISLLVEGNGSLQPIVELIDPSSVVVGSATALGPSQPAVIQTVPTTGAGTYTIRVRSAGGTAGHFSAHLVLNAALESEEHGGPANDSGTPHDLDPHFFPLGAGQAERAALVGMSQGPLTRVVGDDFESGALDNSWVLSSSQAEGRIQVNSVVPAAAGSHALVMDRFPNGAFNLNEAIWTVDLSGVSQPTLRFFHTSFADEVHPLPDTFTGSADGDGVAISDDGINWHTVLNATTTLKGLWEQVSIDLAAEAAAAGMTLGSDFRIKFQQYDERAMNSDGRGYDEIEILEPALQREDWYALTLDDGEAVTVVLSGAGTVQLFDSGSDPLAGGLHSQNAGQVISDYVDMTTDGGPDTYRVRVTGPGSEYRLIVARGASVDSEPNDGIGDNAQDLTLSSTVLGTVAVSAPVFTSEVEPNDDSAPGGQLSDLSFANDLSNSFTVINSVTYRANLTGQIPVGDDADWDFYRVLASPGDTLRVNMRRGNLADPLVRLFDNTGAEIAIDDNSGSGSDALLTYSDFSYAGDYYVVADSVRSFRGSYTLTATLTTTQRLLPPPGDDYYRVEAVAGDVLSIQTVVPAAGPGEFVNELDVAVELYDPTGAMVASDPSGTHSHTAAMTGAYSVRIFGESDTGGEYVLNVSGHTGSLPPFVVTSSDPADGARFDTMPAAIRVELSDQVLLTSVDAADLTVDAGPATDVTVVDANTLEFSLPTLAEGANQLSISAGALTDLQGQPIEAFDIELVLDTTGPRVIDSSIQEDDVVSAQVPLVYTAVFDEPLEGTNLDAGDVQLVGQASGVHVPTAVTFDPDTATLSVEFDPLPEDSYTLTLTSGDGALEDLVGNDFDGEPTVFPIPPNASGDGTPGGDLVIGFATDVTTSPYPVPLEPKRPAGSLIYDPTAEGVIGQVDDVDSWVIDLDDGQSITVLVEADSSLQATVELVDPGSTVIGSATAAAAGQHVLIQTAPTTGPGTYTVHVGSVGGTTGRYTTRLILNAALEWEQLGGAANDTTAGAEDIDAYFVSLGVGNAERAAVLGQFSPSGTIPVAADFESGALDASWTTSSSEPEGRFQITGERGTASGSFALLMDRSPGGALNLNEAIWTVDLSGLGHATLSFFHANFSDEAHPLPLQFNGSVNGDGVAISDDGVRWHTVLNAPEGSPGTWQAASVDLVSEAAAAGMVLGPNFQIKFQQYDNGSLPGDGRGYDEIQITGLTIHEDWYQLTLDDAESLSLALAGGRSLQLYDSGLNQLATGVRAPQGDLAINHFVDTTTDAAAETYFVRVVGTDPQYGLVATRGADFDTEWNNHPDTAQEITREGIALGHVAQSPASTGVPGESGLVGPVPVLQSFAGPGFSGSVPADATIAAGPEQIVTLVNKHIAIYDKLTGEEVFRQSLQGAEGFFGSAGATTFVFNPWVRFDAESQRFFAIGLERSPATIYLAVSTDATPTDGGDWYKHRIDFSHDPPDELGDGLHYPDYPKLGINADAIWISGNYTPIIGHGIYAGITAIEKAPLLSGGGPSVLYEEFFRGRSVFPVTQFGSPSTQYFAEVERSGGTWVQVHAVHNVLSTPVRSIAMVDVPEFDSPFPVPQLGGGRRAEVLDARIMTGVWRDGSMWVGHAILDRVEGDSQTLVRWYEIATNHFPHAPPTLVQSGNVDAGPQVWAWMPALAVDARGNMGIGFSVGGSSQYFGAALTGRLAGDPPGITAEPVTEYAAGLANYQLNAGGSQLPWGAYSGLAIDPSDNGTFWAFNQYAQSTNSWATQVASFQLAEPVDEDFYRVEAVTGDMLLVDTLLPASGPGEFVNTLDVAIELYDPGGTLVATGHEGALSHTADADGTYVVRVRAENDTTGEYVLHVQGHTGSMPPFEVTSTDPDDGARFTVAPDEVELELSEAVLLTTVQASDLLINGTPATDAVLVDPTTLRFRLPPLVEGANTISISAGAMVNLQGQPLEAFSLVLNLDTTAPRLVAQTIQEADVLPAHMPLVYLARFDEPLSAAGLDSADVQLEGQDAGVIAPVSFDYDPATSTLTLQFDPLPEDHYTLTLLSGDGAFEDLLGFDLDGEPPLMPIPPNRSGDGVPGGDFVLNFSTDVSSTPFPVPLVIKQPFGSLIYDRSYDGLIGTSGDVDELTIELDAGHTVTVLLQGDSSLQGHVELQDPSGAAIGSATASSPGQAVVLQSVPAIGAGVYAVRVSGVGETTGRFTARLVLNAAIEAEQHRGRPMTLRARPRFSIPNSARSAWDRQRGPLCWGPWDPPRIN